MLHAEALEGYEDFALGAKVTWENAWIIIYIYTDKTVIITLPKLRFNPNDAAKYQNYCYYQAIKYMPWDK